MNRRKWLDGMVMHFFNLPNRILNFQVFKNETRCYFPYPITPIILKVTAVKP